MNASTPTLQRGMYPLVEAARLAEMKPRTVRRWVEGYGYDHRGERRRSDGVAYLRSGMDASRKSGKRETGGQRQAPSLDFEELLTLLLVRAFHEQGLSLVTIKVAAAKARDVYHLDNPFISKRFESDGNRVFIDLDARARGSNRRMIDVLSDQQQFRQIVEPSLFRDLVFIGDQAGEWWPLGRTRSVVVEPGVQFGQPHVAGTGVRTDVIFDLAQAEGGGDRGAQAASEWFGLTSTQIADALAFEERFRRRSN